VATTCVVEVFSVLERKKCAYFCGTISQVLNDNDSIV